MAIVDLLGNTITTGTHVVVAITQPLHKRALLVHGDIVDGVQTDRGVKYFHVATGNKAYPYARIPIVYDKGSTTTGTCVNAATVAS